MSIFFESADNHGFVRVACATPNVHLGDPKANIGEHVTLIQRAEAAGADLILFPELSLTGYSLDDLFLQDTLLDAAKTALEDLIKASKNTRPVVVAGVPLRIQGALYNCAAVIKGGVCLGLVPKTYLPNYREFYEKRWFASALDAKRDTIRLGEALVRFGDDVLFSNDSSIPFTFGVEICEDMWAPQTPSTRLALGGANLILNLSASPVTVGKSRVRKRICAAMSERLMCAYAFSASGPGESTNDLSWDGQSLIYELGDCLAEGDRFVSDTLTMADIDIARIINERLRTPTFQDAKRSLPLKAPNEPEIRDIGFSLVPSPRTDFHRPFDRFPYVPDDETRLDEDCYEAFNIQVEGLKQRLRSTGITHVVIGISGGLDSTHALIVAVKAFDALGQSRKQIHGYTMPGFGTTVESKKDALSLMRVLGISAKSLDIRPAARRMLADLDHPFAKGEAVYDINFENVQAGLRTDFLFRLAGEHRGFVIGTGDLSEMALGWCTYGVGDHMSHYNVNCGAPKTLISHLIRWAARNEFEPKVAKILASVLDRDISPELIPIKAGATPQRTEDKVGPYELQDFTLYYLTRYGMRPSKIAYLAWQAWGDETKGTWPAHYTEHKKRCYSLAEIKAWMKVFLTRFFAAQYKRSAIPNGPKLLTGGALSPRGDWRMPSDAVAKAWLDELDVNVPD